MASALRFVAVSLVLLMAGPVSGLVVQPAAAQLATFKTSELTIQTAGGARHFAIELAITEEQKEQGLMFRPSMAADAGMLFDYPQPRQVAMWMKNTLLPLDMLFVGADGKIVNIRERAVPGSLENIESAGPVRAVIELNGGTVARLGIKPGDTVSGPGFQPLKS
ncbi:MAG TPA: DUF192 domain-containing protein [Stellaceae bacterium]|nr:DUF192 domain-containing protein [Stellaceae bacterium]